MPPCIVIILPEEFRDAWSRHDYVTIAAAIETGSGDPGTSRALVVFNVSPDSISGTVSYHVDMPWRPDRPFPTLRITRLTTGATASHRVGDLCIEPPTGDGDYGRLTFELYFECAEIAADGWDTYCAEYRQESRSAEPELRPQVDPSRYRILETLPHAGPLPAAYP